MSFVKLEPKCRVYVYMYICIYVYVCICIYIYIHTYICIYVYLCIHIYICIYTCTHTCVNMIDTPKDRQINKYTHINALAILLRNAVYPVMGMFPSILKKTHVFIHIQIYVNIHVHNYMYMYINVCVCIGLDGSAHRCHVGNCNMYM